ncbi:MAG: hypothetical protein QOG02_426, partial [Gaiellales bacterium]|nr:hypothetical protein [Gaiellales bacterium]
MTQAVAILGAHAAVTVEASGGELELAPLSCEGTRLTVTADRLRIGESQTLTAR